MRSYIIRDLLIWFSLLVLLPAAIFGIYYLITFGDSNNINDGGSLRVDGSSGSQVVNIVSLQEAKKPTKINGNGNSQELMKRVLLSEALCNDGTQASYYIKKSRTNSTMWLVLLEGGYFCYDESSCRSRAKNSPSLTSSRFGKRFSRGRGIVASRIDENPYWFNANLVTIPYCSSDLWIGNKKPRVNKRKTRRGEELSEAISSETETQSSSSFYFMGQRILDDVFDDLINVYSMNKASLIVLAGQSAGGIGALMNANRIQKRLTQQVPLAQFKLVIDSAWQLNMPYSLFCNNLPADKCFMNKLFANSLSFWNAQLPDECTSIYNDNKWECFLPYKLLPLIKVPTFVIQNLFDKEIVIQQFAETVPTSSSLSTFNESMRFFSALENLRSRMLETVSIARAHTNPKNIEFFISSCVTHSMTKFALDSFRMGNVTLARALHCWIHQNDGECFSTVNSSELSMKQSLCAWPNCDQSCSDVRHPDANNRHLNDFIEYFSYFGLVNYRQVADVLGTSETDVREMGYDKFMELVMEKRRDKNL